MTKFNKKFEKISITLSLGLKNLLIAIYILIVSTAILFLMDKSKKKILSLFIKKEKKVKFE